MKDLSKAGLGLLLWTSALTFYVIYKHYDIRKAHKRIAELELRCDTLESGYIHLVEWSDRTAETVNLNRRIDRYRFRGLVNTLDLFFSFYTSSKGDEFTKIFDDVESRATAEAKANFEEDKK